MLCVAVMLSVMVLGAGAAFSDQDQIENTEAVDACSALNIIGGYEDGSFHPERNIKRSEITKMICVALNGGKDPNVGTNEIPTFTDVRGTADAWAEGYIEACVAQGIVSGVGGGRFSPAGNVTGAQLAKMLLVALGYNSDNEGFTGNAWETNVNVRASQKHLYDGLENMDTSAAVTRDQAAQMVWNAMQAYEVEYKTTIVTDENGNLITQVVVQDKVVGTTNDKITLLRDKYDAWVYVGTLVQVDGGTLTINMSAADQAASDPVAESDSATFTKVGTDYSDLMGQKVKVMFKNGKTNEVIGIYATSDNTVVTANQKDISVDAGKLSINDTKYTLESNGVAVYVDGDLQETNYKAGDFEVARSANVVTFIDSDGNSKIDTACIETYTVAKVTYVSDTQIIAGGKTYKADEDNIASGLAKDDWVIITANLFNQNKDVVKADMASGSVTATRAKTTDGVNWTQYQIDGTWYNETSSNNKDINANVRAGVQADYVAVNGILFYAQKTAGADATLTNVLFVSYVGTNGLNDDQAKVMFPNGDTATITLAEKNYDADWDGSFSDTADGGAVAINNTNAAGHFFEYTKSGNNYKLIDLRTEGDYPGYYGDYTNLDPALTVAADGTKVDKVGGLSIDDDADVILYADNGNNAPFASDVKHITGKQLKNLALSAAGATNDNKVEATALGAFSSKVNGLTRATVIAVEIDNSDGSLAGIDVSGSYAHYGYVLDDATQVDDYTIEFPMWNGEEELTVRVAETNEANYPAGRAVGYASMTSSEVSAKAGETIYTLVDADPLAATDIESILEVDSKNPNKIVVSGSVGEIDLSDYTTVLYVNSKDEEGLTGATATVANSVKVGNTKYYAKNIMILGDLVVIDTIELATGVYENVALPTSGTGLTSVQYVNNHTQKTDANAHVNSYLTVTVQAPASGTLTLTDGLFVDSGKDTRTLNAGENKFEIVITGTDFDMAFGGAGGDTSTNGSITVTTDGSIAAAKVYASINNGDMTIAMDLPEGATDATATISVKVDGVAMTNPTKGIATGGQAQYTLTGKNLDKDNVIVITVSDFTPKFPATATAEQINNALKSSDITLDTAPANDTTVNVPSGRTLTVTNASAGNLTVNLDKGAAVVAKGGTFTAADKAGSVTVSSTATTLKDVTVAGTANLGSDTTILLSGTVTVADGGSLTVNQNKYEAVEGATATLNIMSGATFNDNGSNPVGSGVTLVIYSGANVKQGITDFFGGSNPILQLTKGTLTISQNAANKSHFALAGDLKVLQTAALLEGMTVEVKSGSIDFSAQNYTGAKDCTFTFASGVTVKTNSNNIFVYSNKSSAVAADKIPGLSFTWDTDASKWVCNVEAPSP